MWGQQFSWVHVHINSGTQGMVEEVAQDTISIEKSYSLVHKQPDECPPPVPKKSIELQQYLTVKATAGTEIQVQQQEGGEQSDETWTMEVKESVHSELDKIYIITTPLYYMLFVNVYFC